MKVNFDTVINDIHGEPIQVKDGLPLTLAYAGCEALLTLRAEDSGTDKALAYKLATRIVNGGTIDVTAEDVVLLKQKIGVIYAPIVVGRAFDILEQRGIELLGPGA